MNGSDRWHQRRLVEAVCCVRVRVQSFSWRRSGWRERLAGGRSRQRRRRSGVAGRASRGGLRVAHGAHVVGGARLAFRAARVAALRELGEERAELGARHPRARVRAEPEEQRARRRAHLHACAGRICRLARTCDARCRLAARRDARSRRRLAARRLRLRRRRLGGRQALVRGTVALLDLADACRPPRVPEHCIERSTCMRQMCSNLTTDTCYTRTCNAFCIVQYVNK